MSRHTILFLAANPDGAPPLMVREEEKAIRQVLAASERREHFHFETRWAAQPLDLVTELRRHRPAILHFSGHGQQGSLWFEAADGLPHPVSSEVLARTIDELKLPIRVVVLNACYSDEISAVLSAHVDYVVGMRGQLEDEDARTFSASFYGALGDGCSVEEAFTTARAATIAVHGLNAERASLKVRTPGGPPLVLADEPLPSIPPPPSIRQPSTFSGTTLGARIVEILQKLPGASNFAERTRMIPDLPRPDGQQVRLERNERVPRIDFELIIAQLENLGLPLVEEMLRGCATRVGEPLASLLRDAARDVRAYIDGLQPVDPIAEQAQRAAPAPLLLSVAASLEQGVLAPDHLFEGNNASPPLRWTGAPAGTRSFALVMEDLDRAEGRPCFYWVQHSIPGDVRELSRGAGSLGTDLLGAGVPGVADADLAGLAGYHGPDSIEGVHPYRIRLLALSREDLPRDNPLSGRDLLDWIARRNCVLAEADAVILAGIRLTNRDFLFQGHPVLGRLFGARRRWVFAIISLFALALLALPAWLLGLDDLPSNGWQSSHGAYAGPAPTDNRGFFHEPNWLPIYGLAVPTFLAFAGWFAIWLREAAQRIARSPGGVVAAPRERPFVLFVRAEVARSSRRVLWSAVAVSVAVTLADILPLILGYCTNDFTAISPYWGIAHLHAKRIDLVRNVAFDVIAYLFQAGFVFLFAFITFKFLAFLQTLSYTIRDKHAERGYVFTPYWHDPLRRLGLGPLGAAYTTFIGLALAMALFAALHRIQLLIEHGGGWSAYGKDLAALLQGDLSLLWALGRWSSVSSGIVAMLVALVIPAGVIAYFPFYQLYRFIKRQIRDENDAYPVKVKLAKTAEERTELAARREALEATNVWPNGDAAGQRSILLWLILFVAAIYPPSLLLTVPAFGLPLALAMIRKAL